MLCAQKISVGSPGTQRAMPEAQSTWTKGIGAESNQQNKYSNEVLEPKPKDGKCTHDANPTVS